MNEATRAYIYRIALAALAVLSLYGVLGPDEVPVWTSVIVALLGLGSAGLATANTSRQLPPPYDPRTDDRGESTLMTILIVLVIVVLALFLFGAIR